METSIEAFVYAGTFGIGIEIAKVMIKKYGIGYLITKLQESSDLDKENSE